MNAFSDIGVGTGQCSPKGGAPPFSPVIGTYLSDGSGHQSVRRNFRAIKRFKFPMYCYAPFFPQPPLVHCFLLNALSFGQNYGLSARQSLRLLIEVGVDEILQTSAPTPAKTVDSDRLQLRLQLRLRSPDQNNPVSPIDWFSSLGVMWPS